jgi:hypothetical protein
MSKPILEIYRDYEAFCSSAIGRLSLYARYNSYGRDLMVERLFELLFMNFENFIENAYISYANGFPSINGNSPVRYVILSSDIDIINLYCGFKEYPDWTRWDSLVSYSSLFFNPSPFIHIKNYMACLNEIKTIRNALAHISGSSQTKFETLVRNRVGYFPATGMSVSDYLLTRIHLGRPLIYFKDYIDKTLIIARHICN